MSTLPLDIGTSQSQGHELVPEQFQADLEQGMTAKLMQSNPPPCLLQAPTGSGKTFVVCRVMTNVSAKQPVLWFWFVPFVNLVQQALDAVHTNAESLAPFLLADGMNQHPAARQVLVSTTQGVSRAAWRTKGYNVGGGETSRTPAEYVTLARSEGLCLGVVVDEAHIALDQATEFGRFVAWLKPEYLLLATATPKSQRITEFLGSAQMGSFEAFNVSRDDVVRARLNKQYIEAVIYEMRESVASVADLKRTVLRQAWLRSQAIYKALQAHGIDLKPLLLVQVENGKDSIEEAERDLIELCGLSPLAIGKHSADTPDPELMGTIANNPDYEVLIFKQSAGTGFDAPRAFVLASTKAVNDADFAMQFIGRVMRVHRMIRAAYASHADIPPELNTAHIYLANAEAQKGYQQAVQITDAVRSELDGRFEKMRVSQTRGGQRITNAPSPQPMLSPHFPLPGTQDDPSEAPAAPIVAGPAPAPAPLTPAPASSLFDADELAELDSLLPEQPEPQRPEPAAAANLAQWRERMAERGISLYALRRDMPMAPSALKREERQTALDMDDLVRRCATRLPLSAAHLRNALLAVRGRLTETERRTELTTRATQDGKAQIIIDRRRIAREAAQVMQGLPQFELADQRTLVEVLAARVAPRLREALDDAGTAVSDKEFSQMATTAAHWVIRAHAQEITESMHEWLAAHAVTVDAEPLPEFMLHPTEMALDVSPRNLYGVLPPCKDELLALESQVLAEDRALLYQSRWTLADGQVLHTARFDQTHSLNSDELAFSKALDKAEFVAWWFRNPDRKGYAVRLVRGEHQNFFHPDFVVCLSHVDGAEPVQRLIETKHDLKDALRKSKHVPDFYGRVLFLTKDGSQYRMVSEEKGLGDPVDLDDLEGLREALQRTAP